MVLFFLGSPLRGGKEKIKGRLPHGKNKSDQGLVWDPSCKHLQMIEHVTSDRSVKRQDSRNQSMTIKHHARCSREFSNTIVLYKTATTLVRSTESMVFLSFRRENPEMFQEAFQYPLWVESASTAESRSRVYVHLPRLLVFSHSPCFRSYWCWFPLIFSPFFSAFLRCSSLAISISSSQELPHVLACSFCLLDQHSSPLSLHLLRFGEKRGQKETLRDKDGGLEDFPREPPSPTTFYCYRWDFYCK